MVGAFEEGVGDDGFEGSFEAADFWVDVFWDGVGIGPEDAGYGECGEDQGGFEGFFETFHR